MKWKDIKKEFGEEFLEYDGRWMMADGKGFCKDVNKHDMLKFLKKLYLQMKREKKKEREEYYERGFQAGKESAEHINKIKE